MEGGVEDTSYKEVNVGREWLSTAAIIVDGGGGGWFVIVFYGMFHQKIR